MTDINFVQNSQLNNQNVESTNQNIQNDQNNQSELISEGDKLKVEEAFFQLEIEIENLKQQK